EAMTLTISFRDPAEHMIPIKVVCSFMEDSDSVVALASEEAMQRVVKVARSIYALLKSSRRPHPNDQYWYRAELSFKVLKAATKYSKILAALYQKKILNEEDGENLDRMNPKPFELVKTETTSS